MDFLRNVFNEPLAKVREFLINFCPKLIIIFKDFSKTRPKRVYFLKILFKDFLIDGRIFSEKNVQVSNGRRSQFFF